MSYNGTFCEPDSGFRDCLDWFCILLKQVCCLDKNSTSAVWPVCNAGA